MTDGTSNTFAIGESLYESCQWFSWPNPNGNYAFTSVPVNWKITIFEQTGYGDGTGRLRNSGNWVAGFGFRSKHPGITQFLYGDGRVGAIKDSINRDVYRRSARGPWARSSRRTRSESRQSRGRRGPGLPPRRHPEIPRSISRDGPRAPDSCPLAAHPNPPAEADPVASRPEENLRMHRTSKPCRAVGWVCLSWLVLASGCGGRSTDGQGASPQALPPLGAEDQAVFRELESKTNEIINKITLKYTGLRYEYSEGLLKMLDQIESTLSGKAEGDPPRFLSQLEPEEEREHFRESIRRWEEKTGKDLRAEVDALKADVASRPAGKTYHPEFQKKFSQTFDDFIAIEVVELRERRNRAIHAEAETLLAPYRAKNPEAVRRIERILNAPPYNLPETSGPSPTAPKPQTP